MLASWEHFMPSLPCCTAREVFAGDFVIKPPHVQNIMCIYKGEIIFMANNVLMIGFPTTGM